MSETTSAGLRPRTETDASLSQKNPGLTACEVCRLRDAAGVDARTHEHVCEPCSRLRPDGGLDSERFAALDRQADAMEMIVEEFQYQNAILTEIAHALHQVAVNANEHAAPDEKRGHSPTYRGLHTRIDDQRYTREVANK